jgi:hypothetical protein
MKRVLTLLIGISLLFLGCTTTFKKIETTAGAAHIRINNSYVGVTPLAHVQVPYSETYIVEADPVDSHPTADTRLVPQRLYVTSPIPKYLLIDLSKEPDKGAVNVWVVPPR